MLRNSRTRSRQRFQGGGERAFGEIVAIEKNQLKLRNRWQGERTVTITDQTTFLKQGKPSTLQDLKVGDRVMAIGKQTADGFTATRIMSGPMSGGRRSGPNGRETSEPKQ